MNNVTPPVVELPAEQPIAQDDDQRALEQSEKKATEQQPDDEKVVETDPDLTDAPIQGIDPPERSSSQ